MQTLPRKLDVHVVIYSIRDSWHKDVAAPYSNVLFLQKISYKYLKNFFDTFKLLVKSARLIGEHED